MQEQKTGQSWQGVPEWHAEPGRSPEEQAEALKVKNRREVIQIPLEAVGRSRAGPGVAGHQVLRA